MTDHMHLTEALKFGTHIQSTVNGLSGGIVIMWKEDIVKLDSITITQHGVHVMVKVLPNLNSWLFYAIYASPDLNTKMNLWNELYQITNTYNNEWLIGGDLNEVT
ncbi:hypothetical protein R3W88_033760 [Solanum pinnatisectum]|uniref:Endonuclease/exonuclease/phosphatase domain-containing protein n=1 Tax=Solanum pinnatisectum TaxID=50273 RepID=A0AAV9K029_9SOLN|nr:hypothetical protein R3W88_033760 [Solanum pinnatisectum]